jgi:hypothetical protein
LVSLAFAATGAIVLLNVASGISTGNIHAVTVKGSSNPPVLISRKESPDMFWGNIFLQSFSGIGAGALGLYGCLKKPKK